MLRKLISTLLVVAIASSVWVSTVAADQVQGPLSSGCAALNALVPPPQTNPYYNVIEVYGLEFFPGETIHISTTVEAEASTTPVPPGSPPPPVVNVYVGVTNDSYGLLATNEQNLPGGQQYTVSIDYVVVAGDGADGGFVESSLFSSGSAYSVLSVDFSCMPANTPPVANGDSYSTPEDATLNVAAPGVLGNDSDAESDLLTAVLVSGPSNGSLTLNADGSFSYTPAANFSGSDSFTYLANDGQADSNVATVSLTVVSATDQITQLKADVQALVDGGALSAGDANKLFHDLDQAQKHLDKGQTQPTLNMLDKFIKDVDKLIDKGDLSAANAQPLIDAANAIINSLN